MIHILIVERPSEADAQAVNELLTRAVTGALGAAGRPVGKVVVATRGGTLGSAFDPGAVKEVDRGR